MGIKSKVYYQKFGSVENRNDTRPVVKHKGLKKCEELSEKTFNEILFKSAKEQAVQKDLNVKQYRVFAVEVGILSDVCIIY